MVRKYVQTSNMYGSRVTTDCKGAKSQSGQYGAAIPIMVGVIKSDVLQSDMERPTDFQATWVETLTPGEYVNTSPGALCTDGPKWFYTQTVDTIPFVPDITSIPSFINFLGLGGRQVAVATFTTGGIHNTADMALLSKIRDQKLSLGVTAGEARESCNLLLDLVEDALSIVKFVRTGLKDPGSLIEHLSGIGKKGRPLLNGRPHWSRSEKAIKTFGPKGPHKRKFSKKELSLLGVTSQAAANRWLQYRYGIVPLYNDVIKILDYLIAVAEEKPLYSARVTIKLPDLGCGHPGDFRMSTGVGAGFQQLKVWYSASDPKVRKMTSLGLYPLDILSIAWELTPFSFMIDWFLPVGDSLEALSATRGLTYAYGYRSQKYVCEGTTAWTNAGTGSIKSKPSKDAKFKFGAFQRITLAGFPLVKFPVVENPFGIHTGQRITDVVAITRQLLFK